MDVFFLQKSLQSVITNEARNDILKGLFKQILYTFLFV
jgi:hypothetical protein